MTSETRINEAAQNTDREIWREREGDYYADSIHVTASGGIGIDCGGEAIVKPLKDWFALAHAQASSGEGRECGKPTSCARHRACMYMKCHHGARDITDEIDRETARRASLQNKEEGRG